MRLFTIEHSRAAYRADFALYGGAVALLALFVALSAPAAQRVGLAALALAGLASWSALEYALHRFVLHGLEPFRGWHAEHHRRPTALICAPTVLSGSLVAGFVFLPALLAFGPMPACATTLGVLTGYLVYAITHHALHHWRADSAWLQRRKRWHARHHHSQQACCYGVTGESWDRLFGTVLYANPPRRA